MRSVYILISNFYYVVGVRVAKHPVVVIVLSLLLTCTLIVTPMLMGLVPRVRLNHLEKTYATTESASIHDRQNIRNTFGRDAGDNFTMLRYIESDQFVWLIVHANGSNVLTNRVVRHLRTLDASVRAVSTDDSNLTFADMCGMSNGVCVQDDLLTLLFDLNVSPSQIGYPVHKHRLPNGDQLEFNMVPSLSGVTVENGGTRAEAIMIRYYVQADTKYNEPWQEKVLDAVAKLSFPKLYVARWAAISLGVEMDKCLPYVVTYTLIGLGLLALFTQLSCLSTDWLRSRPQVAWGCLVSGAMAIVSGYGICALFHMIYIDIVGIAPYLIMNVSTNDAFIMLSAWRSTDERLPVEERMGQMYREAAVSITITSTTNIISLIIESNSSIPGIQILTTNIAIGICFTFFYQVTFFGACLAIAGFREEQGNHPVTCKKVIPLSEAGDRSCAYRIFCCGGHAEGNKRENLWHEYFFTYTYPGWLNKTPVKLVVASLFVVYVAVTVYGNVNKKMGMHLSELAIDDSYVAEYYKQHERYFNYLIITVMVEGRIEPWKNDDWDDMNQLLLKFENDPAFNVTSVVAWTRQFHNYLGGKTVNQGNFTQTFNAFLTHPSYASHKLDVVWNEAKTAIVATRFHLFCGAADQLKRRSRKIPYGKAGVTVTIFTQLFIYLDTLASEIPTVLYDITTGVVVSFVVSFLFLPSSAYSVLVALCMLSISSGVIGFLPVIGVRFNYITMIENVMCIGWCIDSSVHMMKSFLGADEPTGAGRLRTAMSQIGYPITQGLTAMFLSCCTLYFAPFQMFRVFNMLMTLVISFSYLHSMVVLPVVLLIISHVLTKAQQPCSSASPAEEGEMGMDTLPKEHRDLPSSLLKLDLTLDNEDSLKNASD